MAIRTRDYVGGMSDALSDTFDRIAGINDRRKTEDLLKKKLEREKVLQGRQDAIWNRQQQEQRAMDTYLGSSTPQQLATASLAAERDVDVRKNIDAMSFTPEELKIVQGDTYVDEYGLERSKNPLSYDSADALEMKLLGNRVDSGLAKSIANKVRLQEQLGADVNKLDPKYESELMARQRAFELSKKAGGGAVPSEVLKDLRSAREAEVVAKEGKRSNIEKTLAELRKQELDLESKAAKSRQDSINKYNDKSNSGGGSKVKDPTKAIDVETYIYELGQKVSPDSVFMPESLRVDSNKLKKAAEIMKQRGYDEDTQKYVLTNMVRGSTVIDPTAENIARLAVSYDSKVNNYAKGGIDTSYIDTLNSQRAGIKAQRESATKKLDLIDADPLDVRLAQAREALGETRLPANRAALALAGSEVSSSLGRTSSGAGVGVALESNTVADIDATENSTNVTTQPKTTTKSISTPYDERTVEARMYDKKTRDAADLEMAAVLGISPYHSTPQERRLAFTKYLAQTGGEFESEALRNAYEMYGEGAQAAPKAPDIDSATIRTKAPLPADATGREKIMDAMSRSGLLINGMGLGNEAKDLGNRLLQGGASMANTLVNTAMLPVDATDWYYGTNAGEFMDPLREKLDKTTREALAARGIVGADADRVLIAQSLLTPGLLNGGRSVLQQSAKVNVPKTTLAKGRDIVPTNTPTTTISGGSRTASAYEVYRPIIQRTIEKVRDGGKLSADEIEQLQRIQKSLDANAREGILDILRLDLKNKLL